jgi:hypothetical protein
MEAKPDMKLYHGRYILPALGAFLVIVTLPAWRGVAARGAGFQRPPNPHGERCLEPISFIRAQHMRLLVRWRDEVVREGRRVYVASDGRTWEKSLKTCLACHGQTDAQGKSTTAAAACNDCHHYVNAKPDCWNCHPDSATAGVTTVAGNSTVRPTAAGEALR